VREVHQQQLTSVAVASNGKYPFCQETVVQRLGGDVTLFREVVTLLRETAPQRIAELREAADGDDLQQMGRVVHAIRGAISYVDNGSATSTALRLEEFVAQGNLFGAKQLVPMIVEQIEQLVNAITESVRETAG